MLILYDIMNAERTREENTTMAHPKGKSKQNTLQRARKEPMQMQRRTKTFAELKLNLDNKHKGKRFADYD